MRISVSSAQNMGKTTFVNDFLKTWPMYKKSEGNYRKLVIEKGLNINKQGDKDSQMAILNSIVDEMMTYKKTDDVIHDRTSLDNLVYSMWLAAHELGNVDDAFIQKTMQIVKVSMSFLDLIVFIPKLEKYPIKLEEREMREMDEEYQTEIDNFYKAIQTSYNAGKEWIFPFSEVDGSPAMVEIYGQPNERIEMMKLYLDQDGEAFGKKASDTLITLPSIAEQAEIDKIRRLNTSDSKRQTINI